MSDLTKLKHFPAERKRASNFSMNEVDLLLELVERRKPAIINKKNDSVSNSEKARAWFRIQEEFNMETVEGYRSVESLKGKFENLKKTMRRASSTIKEENVKATGDKGVENVCTNEENILVSNSLNNLITEIKYQSEDDYDEQIENDVLEEKEVELFDDVNEEDKDLPLILSDDSNLISSTPFPNRKRRDRSSRNFQYYKDKIDTKRRCTCTHEDFDQRNSEKANLEELQMKLRKQALMTKVSLENTILELRIQEMRQRITSEKKIADLKMMEIQQRIKHEKELFQAQLKKANS